MDCECGFTKSVCDTNPCYRKKIARAGLSPVPDGYSKLPHGAVCECPKRWRDANGDHWCCLPSPDVATAEVDRIMNLSEEELRAELEADGDTLEGAADRGRVAFERAKVQADAKIAIQAWLKCPREKRPSAEALGQRITEIARTYPR